MTLKTALASILLATTWITATNAQAAIRHDLDIPAQELGSALVVLAKQAHLQVVYSADLVQGHSTRGLSGSMTPDEALDKLLAKTGLTYEFLDEQTVTLSPSAKAGESSFLREGDSPVSHGTSVAGPAGTARNANQPGFWSRRRLAQADTSTRSEEERKGSSRESKKNRIELEEIVVTGTHIKGIAPVGSPVQVIEREEIDRAGFATAQQLIKYLPQNFGGDASAELIGTDASPNVSGGTGVNLRGLGAGATLTLLNGRRLSQSSGLIGDFVDITSIPLTAVERVEVLADGASAIYGSDAIAGVVNFILREDYDGAETRMRVASDTGGGPQQYQLGQTFGKSWGSGNVLLAYEYFNGDALNSAERAYSAHSDHTSSGGDDFRRSYSNPGTIVSPALAAIPRGQDGTNLTPGDLLLGQRSLTEYNLGRDLFRAEERHDVFLTARQRLSDSVKLFGEFLYAKRDFSQDCGGEEQFLSVPDTNPYFVSPVPGATSVGINYNFIGDLGPLQRPGDVVNYSSGLGGTLDFKSGWQLELYGSYAREEIFRFDRNVDMARVAEALGTDDPATAFNPAVDGYFNPFADGSNSPQNVLDYIYSGGNTFESHGEARSLNAKVDGDLFQLPGGTVKLAIGSQYREELYAKDVFVFSNGVSSLAQGNSANEKRDISSVFGEVTLPLVGKNNSRPGLQRLELSAALRYEDYSDFGSTSDPKFGAVWSPVQGVSLRGSWGTSFKAPDLQNLIPSGQFFFVIDYPDPAAADGDTTAFFLTGSNPQLTPETSTAKTFGIDFKPAALPGFTVNLTYFDIHYEKRIGTIPGLALSNLQLFAPVLTFNPDPAAVQSLFDSPFFFGDFSGGGPIEVVIDGRLRNLAITDVSGYDVTFAYGTDTSIGNLSFTLNGNYIRKFDEAVAPTAPSFDTVNTLNHPVDLRLRASASWAKDNYGAFVFVNYTDSYQDTESVPVRVVDNWTTVDLTLRYDLPEDRGGSWLRDLSLSLNAQNLFDADPPLVNSPYGYDAANASAVGRVVSLSINKKW